MYLAITIPALIFNCICNYLSLPSLYKFYYLSEYSPRLLLIAIIIISSFPASLLSVLSCALNLNILSYGIVCYIFTAFDKFLMLSWLSLFFLTLYVLLILFTNFPRKLINRIGYCFIILVFIILGLFEFVFLPYYGSKPLDSMTIMGKNYKRYCSIDNDFVRKFIGTSKMTLSWVVFLISMILLVYYYYFKKIGIRDKKHKLFFTLAMFSLISIIGPFQFFLVTVLGINIHEDLKNVVWDITKAASGLYALVYYLVEVYSRKKLTHCGSKFVLRIDKTREIYKQYCEERGYRQLHNMIIQWEKINQSKDDLKNYEVLDQKSLTKKEALKILEKHCDEKTYELVWYDPFYYYYLKLEKLAEVDIDLMMEGKDSNK